MNVARSLVILALTLVAFAHEIIDTDDALEAARVRCLDTAHAITRAAGGISATACYQAHDRAERALAHTRLASDGSVEGLRFTSARLAMRGVARKAGA